MDVNHEEKVQRIADTRVRVWDERPVTRASCIRHGSWMLYGDEIRRVVNCAHSKTGTHKTGKVHFVLDNGVEDIVRSTTIVRLFIRTYVILPQPSAAGHGLH
jgi:hypothetical protein